MVVLLLEAGAEVLVVEPTLEEDRDPEEEATVEPVEAEVEEDELDEALPEVTTGGGSLYRIS